MNLKLITLAWLEKQSIPKSCRRLKDKRCESHSQSASLFNLKIKRLFFLIKQEQYSSNIKYRHIKLCHVTSLLPSIWPKNQLWKPNGSRLNFYKMYFFFCSEFTDTFPNQDASKTKRALLLQSMR